MNDMRASIERRPPGRQVTVRIGATAQVVWGVALALACAACGGSEGDGDEQTSTGGGAAGGAESTPVTQAVREVDPATVGSIAGQVRVDGEVDAAKFIVMAEAWCKEHVDGGGYQDDRILVQDGRLQGAFVWIEAGLEGFRFDVPEQAVELDQNGCLFVPRIVGVRAGQTLLARNSDGTMHNVHTKPDRNREKNFGMPAGSEPRDLSMRRAEVMVEVVCDVHAWMKAWVGVVDHPFFAVTGADGTYRFEGVPPGQYTLGVWHEKLGRGTLEVNLDAQAEVDVDDFVFSL